MSEMHDLDPQRPAAAGSDAADDTGRFLDLVENLGLIFWEAIGPDWEVAYVSPRAESVFGFPLSDWIGRSDIWQKILHPEDLARVMVKREAAIRTGEPYEMEFRAVRRSGDPLWIRSIARMVRVQYWRYVMMRLWRFRKRNLMAVLFTL